MSLVPLPRRSFALIGVVFLRERLTPRRVAGALMIAGGAVALSMG